jgi:tRNA G26 N,N-dimethylase Trm1
MRNEAWNEMDRIYTKKLSEKHFWTKIADRNYGICSLVRSGKKCKNCGPQFQNVGPQFWGWQHELAVLKQFSHGN